MHRPRSAPGCAWASWSPTPCVGGCEPRRGAPDSSREQPARAISAPPSPASRRASGQTCILTRQGREPTGAAPASSADLPGPPSHTRPVEPPSRDARPSFRRRTPACGAGPAGPAPSSQNPSGRLNAGGRPSPPGRHDGRTRTPRGRVQSGNRRAPRRTPSGSPRRQRRELFRPRTRSAPIQHAASSPAETSRITKTGIVPPLSAAPPAR